MSAEPRREASASPLFDPLRVAGLSLRNRLAVAPMTRVSASADGLPSARMAEYYAAFAEGGFGLVISEGIYPDKAYAQGYEFQPGLADDAQRDAWRPVVDGVHAHGGRMIAQLMHAGALSQYNRYREQTRGPSAIRPVGKQMVFYRGEGEYPIPVAMSDEEIAEAVRGFAEAAVRAREAGFDGVELHGANGYLLDQFLTEGVNLREDGYGGDLQRRLRLIVETVTAVRAAVGADFPLGVRISQGKVNDFTHKWSGGVDAAAVVFGTLGELAIDYLHTTEFEAWQPAFGSGPSLAALAKRHSGLPVFANGSLHVGDEAAGLLRRGEADLVTLGRGALTHADWPARLMRGLPREEFNREVLSPLADLRNADRVMGMARGFEAASV
ncbi:NADH:flavin oxidoreductase [Pseudomonas sp. CGJS7]|uniref:NADH:flavin oxidoreductase n=1 Tax=Pseudomonas sp. CGJS7 TaxID=3109348 RepID=UPI003009AE61